MREVLSDSYDVYLVLSPFCDNVREFRILFRALHDLEGRHLLGADGYHCPESDTALVAVRFAGQAARMLGHDVVDASIARTGLPMVVPRRLGDEQRRRFHEEHLPRYTTYVQAYPQRPVQEPIFDRLLLSLAQHLASGRRPPSPRRPTLAPQLLDAQP